MADVRMIARLGDHRELDELRKEIEERQQKEVEALARKSYAAPHAYEQDAWIRLKAKHDGQLSVFNLVTELRRDLARKEQ